MKRTLKKVLRMMRTGIGLTAGTAAMSGIQSGMTGTAATASGKMMKGMGSAMPALGTAMGGATVMEAARGLGSIPKRRRR